MTTSPTTINKAEALNALGIAPTQHEYFDVWLEENGYNFEATDVPVEAVDLFKIQKAEFLEKSGLPKLENGEELDLSGSSIELSKTVCDLKNAYQASQSLSAGSFEVLALICIEQAVLRADKLAAAENLAFETQYAHVSAANLDARIREKFTEIQQLSGVDVASLVRQALGGDINPSEQLTELQKAQHLALTKIREMRSSAGNDPKDWMRPATSTVN